MEAMTWLARHGADGDDLALTRFYVLGPSMLLAGLPAWWVLGAYMQWMSRIREIGVVAWVKEVLALLPWRRTGGEG